MILLIIGSIIYLVSSSLTSFFIAFILAYLLQPAIDAVCNRLSIARNLSTLIIFFLFLSIFIIMLVMVVPLIYHQLFSFITNISQYKKNFNDLIELWSVRLQSVDPALANKLSDFGQQIVNSIIAFFTSLANHIWLYTIATVNFITVATLVPVILFYFLRDWPKMVKTVESLLPVRGKSKVGEFFNSINELLSAYIRGQLNVCLILTCFYVVGLNIIGLDSSLLLGLLSGFLIIIPFIGALVSFLLVIISCYFNFGSGMEMIYVSILYTIGHIIEGYILAPKIIGDRIGLHPVWIIFSAVTTANLFGLVGIFFAIPIAGIVKVCIIYILDYYRSSGIYKY
jgi:putative permease